MPQVVNERFCLNEIVASVVRLVVRLLIVAMGVMLFLSLLAAAMVLALLWALRAGWARLTGRPVTPWVMRMDPRTGFSTVFRSGERWTSARRAAPSASDENAEEPAAPRRAAVLPGATDVTDVEPRDVR